MKIQWKSVLAGPEIDLQVGTFLLNTTIAIYVAPCGLKSLWFTTYANYNSRTCPINLV